MQRIFASAPDFPFPYRSGFTFLRQPGLGNRLKDFFDYFPQ
jgi:hypothetical protein